MLKMTVGMNERVVCCGARAEIPQMEFYCQG